MIVKEKGQPLDPNFNCKRNIAIGLIAVNIIYAIAITIIMLCVLPQASAVTSLFLLSPIPILLVASMAIGICGCSRNNVSQVNQRKTKKVVQFDKARIRHFDNEEVPDDILNITSVTQPLDNSFKGPQKRRIPPLSVVDTVKVDWDGVKKSVHGQGVLFEDHEILECLPIVSRQLIEDDVYAYYTRHQKAIIQQQATRGCTAAVTAMLIMDNGKQASLSTLIGRNLGNDNDKMRDIQEAGLNPLLLNPKSLNELRDLILKNRSAIVSIGGSIGGHVIVVDDISEDLSKIRIREPYHGWEITIGSETFNKVWNPKHSSVIQVDQTHS